MRFQVPQFVDIQDKILGPLTLKQFAAYLIVALLLVPMYLFLPLSIFIVFAVPMLGTAALFAHGRFYGQPFVTLLINGIFFYTSERRWLWKRGENVKPLFVSGIEYAEYLEYGEGSMSSLNVAAEMLATAGSVTTEDADDPMVTTGSEAREATVLPTSKEKIIEEANKGSGKTPPPEKK